MVSKIIKFIEMPVSNLAVSAGTGEFLDEGNFEMVSFPESSVPEGAEFGLRVSGDSMEPVYHDGQIVWVQQCDRVGVGEVGIFIYDGDGYIKVYDEQMPHEADREDFTDSYGDVHMQPIMISYNQKYQPRYVSAHSNFQVVGRVL
jgi:SOS-response transcriptional repressor LexA